MSIKGLSLNDNGDYVIYNMPRQKFRLIKMDSETSDYLKGAVFRLESQSTKSGEQIIKDAQSKADGFVTFDGLDLGTYKLTETTAPEGYNLDGEEYTVSIALNEETNTVSVTITDSDGNQLEESSVGGFKFTNEHIPGKITIVKKWEGDNANERPQELVIRLSAEKPEMVVYKATITDKNKLRTQLSNGATKLLHYSKDTSHNYTLEQLQSMSASTNPTAWQIGVADKTNSDPDRQKDVYLYQDSTDPNVYYYWSEAQTIYLPTNCKELFYSKDSDSTNRLKTLKEIDLSELNSSKVEFMEKMFYGCSGLTSLDLSKFDTSKVTTMNQMFRDCTQLNKINFGQSFELDNVTTMQEMFYNCKALTNSCTALTNADFCNRPITHHTIQITPNRVK